MGPGGGVASLPGGRLLPAAGQGPAGRKGLVLPQGAGLPAFRYFVGQFPGRLRLYFSILILGQPSCVRMVPPLGVVAEVVPVGLQMLRLGQELDVPLVPCQGRVVLNRKFVMPLIALAPSSGQNLRLFASGPVPGALPFLHQGPLPGPGLGHRGPAGGIRMGIPLAHRPPIPGWSFRGKGSRAPCSISSRAPWISSSRKEKNVSQTAVKRPSPLSHPYTRASPSRRQIGSP